MFENYQHITVTCGVCGKTRTEKYAIGLGADVFRVNIIWLGFVDLGDKIVCREHILITSGVPSSGGHNGTSGV